jgi:queuine/archaeosine tRNA-ribosyltransferase
VRVVAGINLKGIKPQVWDSNSPYHLGELSAIMVSYAEFCDRPDRRKAAMRRGLHDYLNVPRQVSIYLDNGAFTILRKGGLVSQQEYEEFVQQAKPDWYPIPQDHIPTPSMSDEDQLKCLRLTMDVNRAYKHDGFVPVIHISRHLTRYLKEMKLEEKLAAKSNVALGGIVPNLLRAPKAMAYGQVLDSIQQARMEMADRELHVFGIGGTATLHVAGLLGVDSVDSSGWRNRAARGMIQLPGSGERTVANLGSWRGREPSQVEWSRLSNCPCPACQQHGLDGLKADKIFGFSNRATHNLWVLLNEAKGIETHLANGTYVSWYETHLDNTAYLPLIRKALELHESKSAATANHR